MEFYESWPGGVRLIRKNGVFPPGTDAVLLSSFVSMSGVRKLCDLGCGSGVIGLLLAHERAAVHVAGVELDAAAAENAAENAALNGMQERFTAVCGDLRDYRALLPAGGFDLTVSNPPYFAVGSGYSSVSAAQARDERTCTIADLCAAASYITRWGGRFAVVHRPERLSELLCAMTDAGLEPKRLRFAHSRPDAPPTLVLVQAVRGGKPGLSVEAPLFLCGDDGGESPELKQILRR